jgi:uncharacterized membrane protein
MNENSAVGPKYSTNVGIIERITSIAAGALLVVNALKNRDKFTAAKAAAGGYLVFRGATGHCNIYEMAGKENLPDPVKNINIKTILFVNRPRNEVYSFWRNLSNLPLFMKHLKSVKNVDGSTSKWKAWLPGHVGTIKWKAEIVKDEPGRLLGWNSLPDSVIDNAGKVEFRDADGGTELRVIITYRAPLGAIGAGLAKLLNPAFESFIEEDIKSFKRYIETGVRPEKSAAAV